MEEKVRNSCSSEARTALEEQVTERYDQQQRVSAHPSGLVSLVSTHFEKREPNAALASLRTREGNLTT